MRMMKLLSILTRIALWFAAQFAILAVRILLIISTIFLSIWKKGKTEVIVISMATSFLMDILSGLVKKNLYTKRPGD